MAPPRCICYRRGREALTERHVQAVWYDREMRPMNLSTRRGQPVRVVHPGAWNVGPGPDFTDAVLEIGADGRRVRGDVEVHLSPGDWDVHGHGRDPAYRNVVAHVTWGCGPPPASLPQGAVSIWLGRFVTADTSFSPDTIDLSAYPFARLPAEDRPCSERLKRDPDLADAVLCAAGEFRLRAKARRMARLLAAAGAAGTDAREVFYAEMMNALGYRCNSRGFRSVARTVPYAAVASEPEIAEGAFLGAAQFVDWCRGELRPNNAPEARLRAAARLFGTTPVMDLMEATDFSSAGCRAVVSLLTTDRLMGRGRAGAVLANIVVPFALATGGVTSVPGWLPPEDVSRPVRLTAFRMFGRDHNPSRAYASNGLKIQGLLQIHRDYCLQVHPDCSACTLLT